MAKKKKSKTAIDINTVLYAHSKRLNDLENNTIRHNESPTEATRESVYNNAKKQVGDIEDIDILFSQEELLAMGEELARLNSEYNELHRLDSLDLYISAFSGIVGACVEILLIGIPQRSSEGLKAKPLSDWIRKAFEERFPPEEMNRLANDMSSKVPYDAQDNRNTTVYVEGLSAYYHRLLSLGHDPFLGLIVGVFDIITGRMTTIDKNGVFVSQVMENYSDRREINIFVAIAKQLRHFASDINTSMGLPAPLMSICNLFQFGEFGEYEQTIAEIVQGMYYEGFDFIHFCSLSVSSILIEVITRVGYAIKRIGKEGCSIKDSIPFSLKRDKHPKLATMLFVSHSLATAANAEKVYFTKNPVAINSVEWSLFSFYAYKQMKWWLMEKPLARSRYVVNGIDDQLSDLYKSIDDAIELS